MTDTRPTRWFQRFLLPGFAFKAVVIGGGYATGRELVEFFMPSGPRGGLWAMALATLIWSLVAALTFAFSYHVKAFDYRHFFKELLGPFAVIFDISYSLLVILLLSVFGAAAGSITNTMFAWPSWVGTAILAISIAGFVTFGNAAIEKLFKYVSFLLYGVYALFLLISLSSFGDRILAGFSLPATSSGWAIGGITYASYNIVGAVVVLPVLRHLTSTRDAMIAGVVAGPLAMAPAILFFVAMIGFYPAIQSEALPSDFILTQMRFPAFHMLFQAMIFSALLESGAGAVHAVNERIASLRRGVMGRAARATTALVILAFCMFVADRFGLVFLIAKGYRVLAAIFLFIYVMPLLTIGVFRLWRPLPEAEQRLA